MIAAIKRRRIDSPYTTPADMAKFGPRFPVSLCYLCCSQTCNYKLLSGIC